jgi:type I restriction enzyme, S subunit
VRTSSRWPTIQLGEVVAETQYGTPLKANEDEKGVIVLRMNNITYNGAIDLTNLKHVELAAKDFEQYSVQRGDLLFNRTNSQELVGKMAVWNCDERYAFAGYLVRIRLHHDRADPGYVAAWFNTPDMKTLLRTRAKPSINMSNINATEVLKFPLVLPPLPQQRRIADVLDRAEALRTKRRGALAQLDTLTQAIFVEMFGKPMVNERCWPMVKVCEAGRVQLGRQRAPQYQTGNHTRPYMRVANVYEDRLALSDVLSMDFDKADFAAYRLKYGDILLNEGQSTELVGRPAMWRDELANCCFQNTLVRFQANTKRTIPEFALAVFIYYLRSGEFAKVSSKTSNVAHLGASRFAAMPFPLPPLTLQREFARRVASVEQLRSSHRASLVQLDELFACLQHRAFRGEL